MPGIKGTMSEWAKGKLHSGSKHGPVVKSQKQAVAIGLSEERKAGHKVKPKHEPHHEATAPGHMGKVHDHDAEQGHMTRAPKHAERDGAGRGGHDMEMHHRTEHKSPTHPEGSHTVQGYIPAGEGVAGHPGEVMRMDHDGASLLGNHYSQTDHEPAKLTNVKGPAGGIGMTTGMGKTPSGYGHKAHQRNGNLRLSGHPGSHQLGKRK